jgi:NADP-dependent aldehyde dehydrogenase
VFNGYPTGVEVCPSMVHGGPWPATTDSRCTSVGTAALLRFVRPVCYQNAPDACLPAALKDQNPQGTWRLVDGEHTRASIGVWPVESMG